MSLLDTLIDPQVITLIVEALSIAILVGRRTYDNYRANSASVYRVRMCIERGKFYRQKGSMLIPVERKTFQWGDGTYTIDPARIAYYDPAPTLLYLIGYTLPLDPNKLRVGSTKTSPLGAQDVDDLTERKTLTQLINAGKGASVPVTIIVMAFIIGLFIGIFVSPSLGIHFGKMVLV